MGLRGLFCRIALAVGVVLASPAAAQVIELRGSTCVGGADSVQEAFALGEMALDCGEGRFDNRARFVRTRSESPGFPLSSDRDLVWQTDPSSFSSMLLLFTYADGARRLVDVDAQMAARNWTAGNLFSVPVPGHSAPLAAIDAVVERPHTTATLADMRVADIETARREHLLRALVSALICGLLLVPILYDLLFYRVLRARFMIWHTVMALGMLIYVLTNSGLVFLLTPDLPLDFRWHLNRAGLAVVIACAVMFTIGLLEDRVLPSWLRRALLASVALMLAIRLIAMLDIEQLRLVIAPVFLASFVPISVALAAGLGIAIARGSRAAIYPTIGFSGMLLVGLLALLRGLTSLEPRLPLDDLLYLALIVMALGTSAGVGDRFLVLKSQRDRARLQAARMRHMANTDGLTGLLNRRAFDLVKHLRPGQGLILSDIDRFKQINDMHGHAVGDVVLCHAAQVLHDCMKRHHPDGRVYRLGGEEFAVICNVRDADELFEIAEDLRRAVEVDDGAEETIELPAVTLSSGAVLGHGQLMHVAFSDADTALYRAKEAGRNRSALHGGSLA